MSKQETRDFPLGDVLATVGLRDNGSMWVSVEAKGGAHFQCDFIGDFERGPIMKSDFTDGPPRWVSYRLKEASDG